MPVMLQSPQPPQPPEAGLVTLCSCDVTRKMLHCRRRGAGHTGRGAHAPGRVHSRSAPLGASQLRGGGIRVQMDGGAHPVRLSEGSANAACRACPGYRRHAEAAWRPPCLRATQERNRYSSCSVLVGRSLLLTGVRLLAVGQAGSRLRTLRRRLVAMRTLCNRRHLRRLVPTRRLPAPHLRPPCLRARLTWQRVRQVSCWDTVPTLGAHRIGSVVPFQQLRPYSTRSTPMAVTISRGTRHARLCEPTTFHDGHGLEHDSMPPGAPVLSLSAAPSGAPSAATAPTGTPSVPGSGPEPTAATDRSPTPQPTASPDPGSRPGPASSPAVVQQAARYANLDPAPPAALGAPPASAVRPAPPAAITAFAAQAPPDAVATSSPPLAIAAVSPPALPAAPVPPGDVADFSPPPAVAAASPPAVAASSPSFGPPAGATPSPPPLAAGPPEWSPPLGPPIGAAPPALLIVVPPPTWAPPYVTVTVPPPRIVVDATPPDVPVVLAGPPPMAVPVEADMPPPSVPVVIDAPPPTRPPPEPARLVPVTALGFLAMANGAIVQLQVSFDAAAGARRRLRQVRSVCTE